MQTNGTNGAARLLFRSLMVCACTAAVPSAGRALSTTGLAVRHLQTDMLAAGVTADPDVDRMIDEILRAATRPERRIMLAQAVAARGRRATIPLVHSIEREVAQFPQLLRSAAIEAKFDQMADGSALHVELDRYFDAASGQLVIREQVLRQAGGSDRATRSILASRLAIMTLVWALGETGDPAAATALSGLHLPPDLVPRALLGNALRRASSGRTIRPAAAGGLTAARSPAADLSQDLAELAAAETPVEDRMRIATSLARTATGRTRLLSLLAVEMVPAVQARSAEVLARLAMFDPEAGDRQTTIVRHAGEVGIVIVAALANSGDASLVPRLQTSLTALRSENPGASLAESMAWAIQTLRPR